MAWPVRIKPGERFGHLVAQRRVGRVRTYIVWECLCDCGTLCDRNTVSLTTRKVPDGRKVCCRTCPFRSKTNIEYPSSVLHIPADALGRLLDSIVLRTKKRDHGCVEWTRSIHNGGYGQVRAAGKARLVHRTVWELINGPIPDGLWVLHHCDNRPCCNPSHLFLGTCKDNNDDMSAKGRRKNGAATHYGEAHGRAKITAEQCLALVERYKAGGVTQQQLADEHGVHSSTISLIVRGKNWERVTGLGK